MWQPPSELHTEVGQPKPTHPPKQGHSSLKQDIEIAHLPPTKGGKTQPPPPSSFELNTWHRVLTFVAQATPAKAFCKHLALAHSLRQAQFEERTTCAQTSLCDKCDPNNSTGVDTTYGFLDRNWNFEHKQNCWGGGDQACARACTTRPRTSTLPERTAERNSSEIATAGMSPRSSRQAAGKQGTRATHSAHTGSQAKGSSQTQTC